ncbi:MerR family transcriptional regulator [Mycobacterium sp.]|uniref:MerR family transcriptional regulator n=1 Tax=Mycobacterium sp. TaxID=1785 RepID=UPI003F97E903
MDLVLIGQAAARLGLSPSTLRCYDERGLVCPPDRRARRRMYGSEELRGRAFASRRGMAFCALASPIALRRASAA